MKRRVCASKVAEYYLEDDYQPTEEEILEYRGKEFDLSDPDDYAIYDEEVEKHLSPDHPKNHSVYGIKDLSTNKQAFFYVDDDDMVKETRIYHPTHAKEYPGHFVPNHAKKFTWEDAVWKIKILEHWGKQENSPVAGIQWFITHN